VIVYSLREAIRDSRTAVSIGGCQDFFLVEWGEGFGGGKDQGENKAKTDVRNRDPTLQKTTEKWAINKIRSNTPALAVSKKNLAMNIKKYDTSLGGEGSSMR